MRNIAPSRALMRRSRQYVEIAFVLGAAGIFLATFGLALYAVPLTASGSSIFSLFDLGRIVAFFGGIALGIIAMLLMGRALTLKKENDVANIVGQSLEERLGDAYTFIRNVSKRKVGYVDAVLIGPCGVLVFRTLDYKGKFMNEKTKWLKADKRGNWKPMLTSPTQDVLVDVKNLRSYLAERDLNDIPIFGIVVFTPDDPDTHLILKEPVVPATHLSSLYNRLQKNFLAKERMGEPEASAIVNLLFEH